MDGALTGNELTIFNNELNHATTTVPSTFNIATVLNTVGLKLSSPTIIGEGPTHLSPRPTIVTTTAVPETTVPLTVLPSTVIGKGPTHLSSSPTVVTTVAVSETTVPLTVSSPTATAGPTSPSPTVNSENIVTPATVTPTFKNARSGDLSVSILAGSVVAAFFAALGISALVWYFWMRRRRSKLKGVEAAGGATTGEAINWKRAELDGREKFEIDGRERAKKIATWEEGTYQHKNAPRENVYELGPGE